MKKLKIDLELLVQSFAFDDEELGVEYLDKETGDIMNIPASLIKVINGELEESELADWQRELLPDAYSIKGAEEVRYIQIPNLEDSYLFNTMVSFTSEVVISQEIKEKLTKALEGSNPMRNFKNIIFENLEEEEKWDTYEENKLEDYSIKWLTNIGIEMI
ncbi:MAG: hypothetical protein H7Y18_02185 [Clostridiaceae bacterium]|nr:hypothetical protein [Clostridiaceae bacterium]